MSTTYSAETSIVINAPAGTVWDALVNPDMVKQYMHGTTMNADWREGGAITWSGEWNGQSYVDKGTVLKYEPNTLLTVTHWSPLSGNEDKPENYHHVTYEITEAGGQIILLLTHSNSPTQEDADKMIETGWKPTLEAIKKLVESTK
jgi:uncharacterized protein YndB with AHSA1/START domain